jgi:hypothetical protein
VFQTKEKHQHTPEVMVAPEANKAHISGVRNKGYVMNLYYSEQWKASLESTFGIHSTQQYLPYTIEEITSSEMEHTAEKYEATIQQIAKLCRMTDIAHVQLHYYLIPIREILEESQPTMPKESKLPLTCLYK